MKAIELALLLALGLLSLAMVWLTTELERTRVVLEPIATSPLVSALSR